MSLTLLIPVLLSDVEIRGQSVTAPSPAAETDRPIVVTKGSSTPSDSGDRGGPRLLALLPVRRGRSPCKAVPTPAGVRSVSRSAVLNLMLGMQVRHYAVSIVFAVSGRSHPSAYPDRQPVSGSRRSDHCSQLHTLHMGFHGFGVAIFACPPS